jgi:hypothetical protein
MLPEGDHWSRDRVEPVPYQTDWINPDFSAWTKKIYGQPEKLLDILSRVVTTGSSQLEARSHPTGGRTFVYELPEPFIDPYSGQVCHEVDIKGILLTSAGYNLYHENFTDPGTKSEFKINPGRNEIFGPYDLSTARADRDNTQTAISDGFITPIPLVILKPGQLVLMGEKLPVEQIQNMFHLPDNREFAFYVRGWPVTSTRVSDLFPNRNLMLPIFTKDNNDQMIQITRQIRRSMSDFEMPRLKKNLKTKSTSKIFEIISKVYIQQLANVFIHGYYPPAGTESDDQTLNHLSLHNWTTSGGLVEWTPVMRFKDIKIPYNEIRSMNALVNSAHEAMTVTGVGILDDFSKLPLLQRFITDVGISVLNQTGKINSDLAHLIYAHTHVPKKAFTMCGDNDDYIKQLQKNPEMYI